jgi:RNA polymerase sigma factor (sigma-70 family)
MNLLNGEPDESLFILLKEDSKSAFSILYNRYWDKLLEVAFIKLQSQEDAEETVQQVFFQIWNSRQQTTLKYTFRTYISAALKYTIYAKFAERKKCNSIPFQDSILEDLVDDSTQHWLTFSQLREEIETLVAQLPEKCQLVYRLSRDEDFTAKEISKKIGIAEKTVEGHLTKALRHIRSNLTLLFL